ncbi:MAG: cas8c [Paenibacillus sp.]|jgi:CRISPR-associated protein Csd1|nr:cas8c [Paenibacillus sp.]
MIIQALYERYEYLLQDPASPICEPYFSIAKVSYVLEISADGDLLKVIDLRKRQGKKWVSLSLHVPEQSARQSNFKPYFLCDKVEYLLGYYISEAKLEEANRKFSLSRELHHSILAHCEGEEARAVHSFFDQWNASKVREVRALQQHMSGLDSGMDQVCVFRLEGKQSFIHEHDSVRQGWIASQEQADSDSDMLGQCLVTGHSNVRISRIHDNKIRGVKGAQPSGAAVVSFNKQSFDSYNKEQSYNAPISREVAFGYTTALNDLLASDLNCIRDIGDMTIVFWTTGPEAKAAEQVFREGIIGSNPYEESGLEEFTTTTTIAAMRDVLFHIRRGKPITNISLPPNGVPFHVLGLSPNNARLSIRFHWEGGFGSMLRKLIEHRADLEIVQPEQFLYPSISRILAETTRTGLDGKKSGAGVSPALAGDLFAAVVTGKGYPYSLYVSIMNRIRADLNVSSIRASILKAYLARYARIHQIESVKEVLSVSLNKSTNSSPYRLGRLFAVLERTQLEASGGYNKLNTTIKNRYFSAASATPAAVFPMLLKLSQHHISKADYGQFRDREIQEILGPIEVFPIRLDMNQQGMFMLGYYHQKQDFFSGSTKAEVKVAE